MENTWESRPHSLLGSCSIQIGVDVDSWYQCRTNPDSTFMGISSAVKVTAFLLSCWAGDDMREMSFMGNGIV